MEGGSMKNQCYNCGNDENGFCTVKGKRSFDCITNQHCHWKPKDTEICVHEYERKIQTLESQLSVANEEIRGYREALYNVYNLIYEALPTDKVEWQNVQSARNAQLIIEQALSHPTPVDEEKEQIKLELQAYKNQFLKLIEAIEKEFQKDGWCRLIITPEKLQEFKEFVQARSRIEEGEKK
jgi:hypothetical protein